MGLINLNQLTTQPQAAGGSNAAPDPNADPTAYLRALIAAANLLPQGNPNGGGLAGMMQPDQGGLAGLQGAAQGGYSPAPSPTPAAPAHTPMPFVAAPGAAPRLPSGALDPEQGPLATASMQGAAGSPAPGAAPPQAVPQAQPQPQMNTGPSPTPPPFDPSAIAPPTYAPRNHIGDILDNLFLGGAAQRAAQTEYNQQATDYNNRRQMAFLNSLTPAERDAYIASPEEFAKAKGTQFADMSIAGGATRSKGDGSAPYTAPLFSVDPVSGKPITQTTSGTNVGPSLGGGYSVDKSGVIVSSRTGKPSGAIAEWQSDPATNESRWNTSTFQPYGDDSAAAPSGAPPPLPTLGQPAIPSTPPGAAPTVSARNNNPGNVRPSPSGAWQGQTGVSPEGFAVFDTPENGARAAMINLRNKQAIHGLNTTQDIIGKPGVGWAPGGVDGNDPSAYASFVASRLGVKPTDPINLQDPHTLATATKAIFDYESGTRSAPPAGLQPGVQNPYAAPSPQPPAVGPTSTVVSRGRTTVQLSPADSAAAGAPPGVILQRDAQGTLTPVVQRAALSLPQTDQSYLDDLKDQARKSSMLASYAKQFMSLQAKSGQQTGGYHAIPGEASIEGAINPTINSLGQLSKTMIPLQREIGSGPIRMGEIKGPDGGIWGGDVPRVEAPTAANQFSSQQWQNRADQLTKQADFYDKWAAANGTLNGAQAAWERQNGGTTFNNPANSGQGAAPAIGTVSKGYRFTGGNPADKASWVPAT